MLLLKSILFTILIPGTVTVVIPYVIVSRRGSAAWPDWSVLQNLSLLPMALGAAILFRCVWDFAVVGHGTLAPIDPPKQLVARGFYRYVRNPMYLGVLILLLGETLFFQSVAMLVYVLGWLAMIHLVVVLYEEPALRRQFGEPYDRYRQSVRRWVPGKPFDHS